MQSRDGDAYCAGLDYVLDYARISLCIYEIYDAFQEHLAQKNRLRGMTEEQILEEAAELNVRMQRVSYYLRLHTKLSFAGKYKSRISFLFKRISQ